MTSAQTATPSASSTASSSSALPRLVRFAGTVKDLRGTPLTGAVGVTFALYSAETGGSPLWLETQNVTADSSGHYTALLGSTKPDGLPADLFTSEQARWVGVQVSGQGQTEQPRTLLVSAPYALKAGDAETVGGLPPSAFVLAAPATGTAPSASATANASSSAAPPASSNVTTTGGTVNTIPLFTTATNIQNSAITQTGSGATAKVGIGIAAPAATLDIKGGEYVRGAFTLPSTATATATKGANSQPDLMIASAFNSGSAAAVNQKFQLQAEPAGNNTATASGTLNLLFGSGTAVPAETGLSFNSKGLITFASGQTFPGAGTITGITTAAGSGLTGGGTTGTLSLKIPAGGITNAMLATAYAQLGAADTFTSPITFVAGQTFPGTLTAVTAASPVTATTTAGKVSLGLNTTALETTLNAVYPQLGTGNIFTSYLEAYQTSGRGNAAVLGWGSNGSVGTFGDSDTGLGVQGESTSGFGVYAQVTTPAAGSAGVLGFTGSTFSGSYTSEAGIADAGVWADISAGSGVPVALFATADDAYGEAVVTNGGDYPSLYVDNSGGTAVQAQAAIGYGVSGVSFSGTGVYGSTSGGGDGVEGIAGNLVPQQAGVHGVGNTTSATYDGSIIYSGVWGDTGTSSTTVAPAWAIGVLGTADDSHAGVFLNNSSGWSTLYVSNASTGGTGLSATVPGLFSTLQAATRTGTCGIGGNGDLTCTGQVKTLATTGGSRTVETYAMQSPENWMEDFGSGALHSGVAVVNIDPAFAETVSETADYHVFLTPNGDSKGLYVTQKTASSFEVRESGNGTSSLSFDYRIVAKRRGYESQRLTDVTERFNAERKAPSMSTAKQKARPAAEPRPSPLHLKTNSTFRKPAAGVPHVAVMQRAPATHP